MTDSNDVRVPPASTVLPACAPPEAEPVAEAAKALKERLRGLELAKYFSATSVVPGAVTPEGTPRVSPDKTLTALAQLGAFKLNCSRSFISLIDSSHQFIIGEATRSTSLLLDDIHAQSIHHDMQTDKDGDIYLGIRSLELSFGVCPTTIRIFTSDDMIIDTPNVTADHSRYIIRDFCADPNFNGKPYVTGWPHMRSYAEIPLTSEAGFVIGSYCVVDNKPREFGDADIATLSSISSCIMNHLDLLKAKQELRRVEGLLRGIGSYVAGYSGLQEQQTQSLADRAIRSNHSNSDEGSSSLRDLAQSRQSSNVSSSVVPSEPSMIVPSLETSAQESFGTIPSAPSTMPTDYQEPNQPNERNMGDVSNDIRTTFSRAGNLIRQSMEMQGVAFLDARTDGSLHSDNTRTTSPDAGRSSDNICNVLGFSTEAEGGLSTADYFNIGHSLLHRMLIRYPFGHTFYFDEHGMISFPYLRSNQQDRMHPSRPTFEPLESLSDHSEQEDAALLFDAVQQARSIIFVPLWDFQKDKWFAATLGWTNDPTRILDVGDLDYLSAFGNSIMAEVSRLEDSALSRAKSDFMSSVSHELRSPLHGILAGTELMRGSDDKLLQSSLLDTVESCGNMLLDTFDHLLDFAKINKIAATRRTIGQSNEEETRLTVVDLGELVQDVVEGVHLGHFARHPVLKQSSATQDVSTTTSKVDAASMGPPREDVVLLVSINPSVEWIFDVVSGAWRRIVMNLVANALKYTKAGQIHVYLDMVTENSNAAEEPAKRIRLLVQDTGKGISKNFMQDRLFTPFAQESGLTGGIGLGLSIVQKLVAELEGSIDVKSNVGMGTRISVTIPLGQTTKPVSRERKLSQRVIRNSLDPDGRLGGCKLYLPEIESVASVFAEPFTARSREKISAMSATRNLFADIAQNWFGMEVLPEKSSSTLDETDGTSAFILEHCAEDDGSDDMRWTLRTHSPMEGSDIVVTIRQPFGPRKLAFALAHAISSKRIPRRSAVERSSADQTTEPAIIVEDVPISPTSEDPNPSQESIPLRVPEPSSPHLLLVDDNAINLRVLSTCVSRIGHAFTQAMDGKQALSAYTSDPGLYRLIFMDISMPVMDGCTATREIRKFELENNLDRTPIIALTALGAEQAKQEAMESGVDIFMNKPIKMSEVKKLLAAQFAGPSEDEDE